MVRIMRLLAGLALVAGLWCIQADWVYMATNLLVLWAPGFLVFGYAWPRISTWYKVSYLTILLIMFNLCVIVEFVALQYDWWDFSEALDLLAPWRVGRIPLEEFAFWFGGCAQVMILYLALCVVMKGVGIERGELQAYLDAHKEKKRIRGTVGFWLGLPGLPIRTFKRLGSLFKKPAEAASPALNETGFFSYARGAWFPAWTLTVLAFFIASILLVKGSLKKLNAWALLITFLVMNLVYLVMEYNGISRGHWVWNDLRTLGWKLGVIPVEEIALYFSAVAFPNPLTELCHDFLIRVHASDEDKAAREKKRGYRAFVAVEEIRAEIDEALGRKAA